MYQIINTHINDLCEYIYKGEVMAFEPHNKNITEALRTPTESVVNKEETLTIPSYQDAVEKTQNYTFSLQPSVRKKLTAVSKEQGFPSASSFLNSLIKGL